MTQFNNSRNQQKKLEGLRGILQGISSDKKLNEAELMYLDTWLRDASELHHHGDVIDLLEQISDVLEDGVITEEEMHDTLALIHDIEEYSLSRLDTGRDEGLLNEFIGFALGVSADDQLLDCERTQLLSYLQKLEHEPVCQMLKEQIRALNPSNNETLLATVKNFCGQNFLDTGAAENGAISSIFDDISEIELHGKKVCFTGTVVGTPRSELKRQAELLGCSITKTPTTKTDLVIVGGEASKDWIYSSYGRKIETALEHRKKGCGLKIISVERWLELV